MGTDKILESTKAIQYKNPTSCELAFHGHGATMDVVFALLSLRTFPGMTGYQSISH